MAPPLGKRPGTESSASHEGRAAAPAVVGVPVPVIDLEAEIVKQEVLDAAPVCRWEPVALPRISQAFRCTGLGSGFIFASVVACYVGLVFR